MGTTTTTFALNKPTVGGDDNAWGTDWNTNADKLDDLLDGTIAIKPNLDAGLWKVGGVAVTATAAELNILDGVTASAAEINILDGVTASTAELNILDGVTASAAELNILDGATLTVTELNYVDGVTSAIQTQLDAKYDSGDLASQAEAEAGTDNTKVMTPLRVAQAARPQTTTAVASTSGTAITFTGIPSWVKRVTVMFSGVSVSGTDLLLVQGGSGSFETSGYSSSAGNRGNEQVAITAGFLVNYNAGPSAAWAWSGAATLNLIAANTWIMTSVMTAPGTSGPSFAAGVKSFSGVLDRVRITPSGANTFDAGLINIMWE